LIRTPGFTLTAILTLALGIGLSIAVFTVSDALLLRSLPVADQDRLVTLWGETRTGGWTNLPLPLTDVKQFQRETRTVAQVASFEFRGAISTPIRIADRAAQLRLGMVSGNYFEVLGARAPLGRTLLPEDDLVGSRPVLVISHRTWQQEFGGDSTVIGRSVSVIQTGLSYTIVGVAPRGLDYPRGTEAWVPIVAYSSAGGFYEGATGELDLVVRLRPGVSVTAAAAELTGFLNRPGAPEMQRGGRGIARPLAEVILGSTRPALLWVTVAAGLLLLITSLNVANLLLVRGLGRVRELAVRAAVGASRGRLIAQQSIETAMLSFAGGVAGVGLAVAAVKLFLALAPPGTPRLDEIAIDPAALGAALAITAVATVLAGLGPILFGSRVEAQEALRSGARHGRGRRHRLATEALVVTQVSLAVMSLAAAGLVTRSLLKVLNTDLGFASRDLTVAEIAFQADRFASDQTVVLALDQLRIQLEAIPGIRAVSPAMNVPFVGGGGGIDGPLALPGQGPREAARNPVLNLEPVAPNYFATLEIPVRGRAFTERDREAAPPVVILSREAARHFWPREDPIGRVIQGPNGPVTVVGVVPETRYREFGSGRPSAYFPFGKGAFGSMVPRTLLIRTSGPSPVPMSLIRRSIDQTHPGITAVSVTPLDGLLEGPQAQPRLNAVILTVFALASVSLAGIGLFAIIAAMVRQRVRELAIRMVLGATRTSVGRLVIGRGLRLGALGAAIGLVGALTGGRLLSGLLYETQSTDGLTLLTVTGLIVLVATFASYLPARSGMRVEPGATLRGES
jgi:predicted permease